MKKKFFALTLATTMAAASTVTAFAANPVATYNFDDASAFAMEGSAKTADNPDDAEDKVLLIEEGAGGKNGNYAHIDGAFTGTDFSNGATVVMNIRPTAQSSDWNYLFSIGALTEGAICYVDGTTGFIQRAGDPYLPFFPGDGWVDGNAMGGVAGDDTNNPFDYFNKEENANKWYQVAYVYAKDKVQIYVDGILTQEHAGDLSAVLAALTNNGTFHVGCGIDPALENFGGYVDDIAVFNTALSADEVKALPANYDASENQVENPDPKPVDNSTDKPADTTDKPVQSGDVAPIAAFAAIAVVACAAVVVSRKKVVE